MVQELFLAQILPDGVDGRGRVSQGGLDGSARREVEEIEPRFGDGLPLHLALRGIDKDAGDFSAGQEVEGRVGRADAESLAGFVEIKTYFRSGV